MPAISAFLSTTSPGYFLHSKLTLFPSISFSSFSGYPTPFQPHPLNLPSCSPRRYNGTSLKMAIKGISHATGKSILLSRRDSFTDPYIRCQKCSFCYLVPRSVLPADLECAQCKHTWHATINDLLFEMTNTSASSDAAANSKNEAVTTDIDAFAKNSPLLRAQRGIGSHEQYDFSANMLTPQQLKAVVSHTQCPHFGQCSGCTIEQEPQLPPVALELRQFAKSHFKFPVNDYQVDIYCDELTAWRTHAKLAVRALPHDKRKKFPVPSLGLYAENSHDLIRIPNCLVHHPFINRAAHIVEIEARACEIGPYDEDQHKYESQSSSSASSFSSSNSASGLLRYVQLTLERHSGLVQLVLVWNSDSLKLAAPKLQLLVKNLWRYNETRTEFNQPLWHSIWVNFNTNPTNAVFDVNPKRWLCLRGEKKQRNHGVIEAICASEKDPRGTQVYFHPNAFRQANLEAFEKLVSLLSHYIPSAENTTVVEFYGGVGAIGLAALHKRRFGYLVVSEWNEIAEESFNLSRLKLPEELQARAEFVSGRAQAVVRELAPQASVVIVDPPRQGLEKPFLNYFTQNDPKKLPRRFIYISCGFDAFKRDSRELIDSGWKIKHLSGHIFFPGSNHVETLAVFDRPPRRY